MEDSPEERPITTYTAHFHTSLLANKLAHVTDDVFEEAMVLALESEAGKVADLDESGADVPNYYADLNRKGRIKGGARMAIEQAIEVLLRLDFPNKSERATIKGAEWWVQRKRPVSGAC